MIVFQPEGGINFIRKFQKQTEDQGVNLPPNLAELVMNASYIQSPESIVWKYFFDLKGMVCFMKVFFIKICIYSYIFLSCNVFWWWAIAKRNIKKI